MQTFVDLLGRLIFGTFSLVAAIGFSAFFVVLARANPADTGLIILRYVVMELCVIVVIFLVLATVKFWSTAKWVDRFLTSYTMRAGIIIIGFAMTVMAVGIAREFAGG